IVFVLTSRDRNECARGTGHKAPVLRINAERKVTLMKSVRGNRGEQPGFAAPGRSSKSDLVLTRHRCARRPLSQERRHQQQAEQEHKPMAETQQVTPPKSHARYFVRIV